MDELVTKDVIRWLLLIVLIIGVLLRAVLVWVNSEANDTHLQVSEIIAYEGRIPLVEEAWQSYHPKLYHGTVALALKALPDRSFFTRTRTAQLISMIAGVGTLLVILLFLRQLKVPMKVKIISFSLVALNPKLIGTDAQATNNSFVIFFVTLTLFFGFNFFRKWRVRDFALMLVCSVLAGLSKGNGLVVMVAVSAVMVLAIVKGVVGVLRGRGILIIFFIYFAIASLAALLSLGPYWQNYREFGSPIAVNEQVRPWPEFFNKTYPPRVRFGVVSLFDTLATFRFMDLLKNPMITNDVEPIPYHRTSLWSQIYGRAHFVHFDAWPPSWELRTKAVVNIGRIILLLAIVPTLFVLVGICRKMFESRKIFRLEKISGALLGELLLFIAVLGYVAMMIYLSLRYRDFSFMKAVYIFPGLLGFIWLFAGEYSRFYEWSKRRVLVGLLSDVVLVLLLFFYVTDVLILIDQLR